MCICHSLLMVFGVFFHISINSFWCFVKIFFKNDGFSLLYILSIDLSRVGAAILNRRQTKNCEIYLTEVCTTKYGKLPLFFKLLWASNITIRHGNNCTTFRHLSFSSSIASRNAKNYTFRKLKKQNRPIISDLLS